MAERNSSGTLGSSGVEYEIVDNATNVGHDKMENILVDRARVITKLVSGVPLLPAQLPQMDGSWTWLRKCNDDLHRSTRQDAGELLRTAFDKGGYAFRCGGRMKKVQFKCIKEMVAGTKVVRASNLPTIPTGEHQSLEIEHAGSPIDHAIRLQMAGYKVATVNAASAFSHGGGFTSGGRHALEEAFCSQSTLFPSLDKIAKVEHDAVTYEGRAWYPHIPLDGVIVSPRVEMFRRGTDQGYLLYAKPVEITAVISVAMYNCNRRVSDSPVDKPHDAAEYEAGVRAKLVAVAHGAAEVGADALVLCDIGCGVFMNDPTIVGRIAGEVIAEYSAYFKVVCFTGKREFGEAAVAALTGQRPDSAKPRLKHATDFAPRVGLFQCIVCEKKLDSSLCVLLGPSGERALPSFLHLQCSELLCEKWPDHTSMRLPDAARDTDGFFNALDVDGNGILEKEELRVSLAALWSGEPNKFDEEFEKRWATWDSDMSGDISLPDFRESQNEVARPPGLRRSGPAHVIDLDQLPVSLLAWVRLQAGTADETVIDADSTAGKSVAAQLKRHQILDVFRKFDRNNDGTIDRYELELLLKALDPVTWTPENVLRLFVGADLNKDDRISLSEFLTWGWNNQGEQVVASIAEGKAPALPAEAVDDAAALTKVSSDQGESQFVIQVNKMGARGDMRAQLLVKSTDLVSDVKTRLEKEFASELRLSGEKSFASGERTLREIGVKNSCCEVDLIILETPFGSQPDVASGESSSLKVDDTDISR